MATLEATASPKLNGSRVFALGRVLLIDLAGCEIDNELSELIWVARAFA